MDRMNDAALLLGRLAIAALFFPAGLSKALAFSAFAASLASKGLPSPELLAVLAVMAELGGGLGLILGFRTRWIALLLIVFTAVATGTSHRFWEFAGAEYRGQSINFWKNLAIMGGLLFAWASGPGAWSLDALWARAGRRVAPAGHGR